MKNTEQVKNVEASEEPLINFAETAKELSKNMGCEVYFIEGVVDGEKVAMYLREPAYDVEKRVFMILSKDEQDIITAGEWILAKCAIPGVGYDMYGNPKTRLAAALQASQLIDFNATIQLKKS